MMQVKGFALQKETIMAGELIETSQYRATLDSLERVKHTASNGKDYWNAREINGILRYPTWREFEEVIERAKRACSGTGIDVRKHFVPTLKMVELGSNARREVEDHFLSRAACYLIAMNGDPGKPQIAAAQAYFTVQTRRMELADEHAKQIANYEKRLELREKSLALRSKSEWGRKRCGCQTSRAIP